MVTSSTFLHKNPVSDCLRKGGPIPQTLIDEVENSDMNLSKLVLQSLIVVCKALQGILDAGTSKTTVG